MAHSGRFSDRIATRSPGRMPSSCSPRLRSCTRLARSGYLRSIHWPSRLERAATGLVPNRASAPKYSSLRVRGACADTLLEDDDEPLSGAGYGSSVRSEGAYLDDGGVWLSKSDSVEGHSRDRTIRASVERVGQDPAGQLDQVGDDLGRVGNGIHDGPIRHRTRGIEALQL